jgi:hypothetical protein
MTLARTFLLWRRSGATWAVEDYHVARVAAAGRGYRLSLRGGEEALVADHIVGVVSSLALRPPSASLARFWDEPVLALSVHGGDPVVVIDADRPPAAVIWSDEEPIDGGGDDGHLP